MTLLSPLAEPARTVLRRLAAQPSIKSIWLAGSRANEEVRETSDWDLIVFDEDETGPTQTPTEGVDVIRVRPSGATLVDGMGEHLRHDFADWQWLQISSMEATYAAKRWNHGWTADDDGVDADGFSEPIVVSFTQKKALLLWSRDLGFQVNPLSSATD